jgi:dienelactone hydrolase
MKNLVVACLAAFLIASSTTSFTFKSADFANSGESGQTVFGTLSEPRGNGPFPIVVLLHTAGGVLPHVSEDWPSYFNSIGYATFTIDTAGSRGGRRQDWYRIQQIEDAYGALDRLASVQKLDVSRAAMMGFSAGAMAIGEFYGSFQKSPQGRQFGAAISVYPNCEFISWNVKDPGYPLAVIVPENDTLMNSGCLQRPETNIEVHVIDGAYHGFDHSHLPGTRSDRYGNLMRYSPAATARAQTIAKTFLDKNLGR